MSLAANTRRAAADHPFLLAALRAGVLNYTAAARFLAIDGEIDAVATALRRYAEELPDYETTEREARVTMQSGVGPVDDPADALLVVGGTAIGAGSDRTAILAAGEVDAAALATVLETLSIEEIEVTAAGVGEETLVVVVDRLEGANALRAIEDALERVPSSAGR